MIRTTTRIRRRTAAGAVAVTLFVLLAGACGSDSAGNSSSSSGNSQAEDSDRQVKHLACLREHGLDVKASKPGEGQSLAIGGGDPKKLEAALEACRSLSGGRGGPVEFSQADKDAALGFARCMRKNGVDMPDPVFDDNVANAMPAPRPGPEMERFEKANTACSKEFPQSGQSGRAGSGK